MNDPKVSVIVPVYKCEQYLHRCVDSILNQTHPYLELILVDDGSPDGSGMLCDEYAQKDSRVRVVHQENGGAFAARNTALDMATGSYISFVDADDWLELDFIQRLLQLMENYGADIAQCELCNEGIYRQIRSCFLGEDTVYQNSELTRALFKEEIAHGLIGKLFHSRCFQGQRFDTRYYHLDAVLMSNIRNYCSVFVRTDRVMYHYNTTSDSITRGKKTKKHIASMEHLFEAFSDAVAFAQPEGSFFICREIPSTGRIIIPQGEVTVRAAIAHIQIMHRIFAQHWRTAKATQAYQAMPKAKKLLWRIYSRYPTTASVLVYFYSKISR